MALILVCGPRRSGKSRVAEGLARATGEHVVVLAPLTVTDAEMAARVAAHRAARPAGWRTVEGIDVVGALATAAAPGDTVLLDSLGTWVSEGLWRAGALEEGADGRAAAAGVRDGVRAFAAAAARRPGTTIVVAEEAGWGPVPPSGATRLWLDVLGDATQALSAVADRALLVVAGRSVELPVTDDVHGDVWARGARADHAVNVATGGPPSWLLEALHAGLDAAAGTYPDEREAMAALAARHGRAPEEVVLLNGAAQGYGLVGAGARWPVAVHPQFMEPERVLGAERVVLPAPWALEADLVPEAADLVVVGNPTNPTGVLHPRAAVEALVRRRRLVLVDEAFMDFVGGERESLADGGAGASPGVVVLRSLTKILSVPGLRVGYLLAERRLAARLREARPAWSVNTMALIAAREATPARLAPIAARARADRAALAAALRAALPAPARVHEGAANFVLVELPGVDGVALARAARARRHRDPPGRDVPGLAPGHVRLTARGGAADARLVAALSRRA